MAINLMQMPTYDPGNGIDFSPISNALTENRQQQQWQQQNKLAQAGLDMQRERLGFERNRLAMQQETHGVQMASAQREQDVADARDWAAFHRHVSGLPEDQQQAMWARRFESPRFKDHPAFLRDFKTVGPYLYAAASQYLDEKELAALGLTKAQTGMAYAHTDLYRAQAADFQRKAGMPANADPEFAKAMAKKHAETYQGYIDEGDASTAAAADFKMLDDLNKVVGSGAWEAWKPTIGPYAQSLGINVSGLSAAQTFQAIANKLTPGMRPKGSGSTSDKDMAIFQQSLPQLSQTPAGRTEIINTFKALHEYKIERARIANDVANGYMSRQDGMARIRALQDPFARIKAMRATGRGTGGPPMPTPQGTQSPQAAPRPLPPHQGGSGASPAQRSPITGAPMPLGPPGQQFMRPAGTVPPAQGGSRRLRYNSATGELE
ncbi:hypothetical protein [Hyphomicrobium sp. CS1BSMeth3]|uniref:hypothetical protein n=1 Tax=Hyphomicrobium sp. CS1BSMeth3 TaxID=1892844 RepID=UPI000931EE18|nr:hypothetical protein [Hyphomicrobium sp. CS1BSMeth3]